MRRTVTRSPLLRIVFTLALFLAWLISPRAARAADCTYDFGGHVEVEHQDFMRTLLGRTHSRLAGVEVRLQGRIKGGTWNAWDTVRTDSQGNFRIVKTKDCKKRELQISVKFDSDQLSIFHANSTDQVAGSRSLRYVVWKKNIDHKNPVIETGITLRFRQGGQGGLGEAEPRGHAEIWVLYRRVIAHMATYGSQFAFNKHVKVKHPHNKQNIESYANPINNVIYLVRKNAADDAGRDVHTMIHELMHIWAYQHSKKEDKMATYLLGHMQQGTHHLVKKSFVAFHEGFAEFAKDMVLRDAFGQASPPLVSRSGTSAANFGEVELRDTGWRALFLLLERLNLKQIDFSQLGGQLTKIRPGEDPTGYKNCHVGRLSFAQILGILERGKTDIKTDEMSWDGFFREAVRQNRLHQRDRDIFRAILDPAKSAKDVYDAMCTKFQAKKSTYDPNAPITKVPEKQPIKVKLPQ